MRITLEIRDGLDVGLSLKKLARWYDLHDLDPKAAPMTGVCTYHDNTVMFKREYTKTDCFLIHRETRPAHEGQGETK